MHILQIDKDAEIAQRQVWLAAWLTVAACENALDKDTAARWADACLKAYNDRFPIEREATLK
jgi:hypothetical protein